MPTIQIGETQVVWREGESQPHELRPGRFGEMMLGQNVSIVKWTFPPDTPQGKLHSHSDHEQWTYIISGRFQVQIGDEVTVLEPGDVSYAPKTVMHGNTLVVGDEPVVVLDIFSPPRDEFVNAAAGGPPVEVEGPND
jgi:quercetin dioxygenase-like cupin family protein